MMLTAGGPFIHKYVSARETVNDLSAMHVPPATMKWYSPSSIGDLARLDMALKGDESDRMQVRLSFPPYGRSLQKCIYFVQLNAFLLLTIIYANVIDLLP
jgi:hypothetical protein